MIQNGTGPGSNLKDLPGNVTADVIVLGCTVPGIVVAHKLKKVFGSDIEVVVLDLEEKKPMKHDVTFQGIKNIDDDDNTEGQSYLHTSTFLQRYANEFNFPLPEVITSPSSIDNTLNKVFQYHNGNTVSCTDNYHDFAFLSYYEQLELNQYQNLLDYSIVNLFSYNKIPSDSDRKILMYYDRTNMEEHICGALLFPTPREIMRVTVRLVCGASPETVSVLFYLHQCHRTNSARNHLDGKNTRLREKLIGYCQKRITSKLQASIADITVSAKSIVEIRSYPDEKVILETIKGDHNYVCDLLAMALKPDELNNIRVEAKLLSSRQVEIAQATSPGRAKTFHILYEENFWRKAGYSGDILSIQGPIIWAMERPKLSSEKLECFAGLIGFLKVNNENEDSSKDAVIEQLVSLFGEEALKPTKYMESILQDVYVPKCGNYVALRNITTRGNPRHLEWGALDIFADGDLAAALEAGNVAYLHLLRYLRPQAQTFDDLSSIESRTVTVAPLEGIMSHVNYISTMRVVAYSTVLYIGYKLIRSYTRK